MIQNIVLNADQAMPQGGTVEISARNVRAPGARHPRRSSQPGDYAAVSVRDSGVGIPPENLARIFDPYFTTKEKGSGLGLATSYSIVRNHGGAIVVESEPGTGSTLHLLPAGDRGGAGGRRRARPRPRRPGPPGENPADGRRGDGAEGHRGDAARCSATRSAMVSHGLEAVAEYQAARESGTPFDLVLLDLTIRGGMGGRRRCGRCWRSTPT